MNISRLHRFGSGVLAGLPVKTFYLKAEMSRNEEQICMTNED